MLAERLVKAKKVSSVCVWLNIMMEWFSWKVENPTIYNDIRTWLRSNQVILVFEEDEIASMSV